MNDIIIKERLNVNVDFYETNIIIVQILRNEIKVQSEVNKWSANLKQFIKILKMTKDKDVDETIF